MAKTKPEKSLDAKISTDPMLKEIKLSARFKRRRIKEITAQRRELQREQRQLKSDLRYSTSSIRRRRQQIVASEPPPSTRARTFVELGIQQNVMPRCAKCFTKLHRSTYYLFAPESPKGDYWCIGCAQDANGGRWPFYYSSESSVTLTDGTRGRLTTRPEVCGEDQ